MPTSLPPPCFQLTSDGHEDPAISRAQLRGATYGAFPPAFPPTTPSWPGKESGPDRDGGVRGVLSSVWTSESNF